MCDDDIQKRVAAVENWLCFITGVVVFLAVYVVVKFHAS